MRLGQNPAKHVEYLVKPQQVTIAVVTYIPFLRGYYAESLDVLKVCLNSIWDHTDQPFDLLVFDNDSCEEVRRYLIEHHHQGLIQYLVLSDKNVGVPGAWNFIFKAAPGEYVAYADSDVYFYPGWLSALMSVFDAFPKTGMVTGMPLLNPEEFSTSTIRWAEENPEVSLERGRLLSWEEFWRHAGTLGNDEAKARAYYEMNDSLCLQYRDERYYAGAGHFQFLARQDVLQQVLPFPGDRPMGQERFLDARLNERGYLRLSTKKWWVQHLGNTLHSVHLPSSLVKAEMKRSVIQENERQVWKWKPLRSLLEWVHGKTFDILYRN